MADPVQYESFGKMMFDHAPFVIAGALALIGLTTMIWKKLGFLDFDKDNAKKKGEICDHCSLVEGKNGKEAMEELKRIVKCDTHESLCDTVKEIRSTQIKMEQQQKTNISKLNNGKEEFDKLHSRISTVSDKVTDLRVGMAVLLSKVGQKIKEFDDIKVD